MSDYNGIERRKDNLHLGKALGKIEQFMENSNQNQEMLNNKLDSKLEKVTTQLESIDEKLSLQVDRLTNDIVKLEEKSILIFSNHQGENEKEHTSLNKTINTIYDTLDTRISRVDAKLETHINESSICQGEVDKKLKDLQDRPIQSKAKFVDQFLSILIKIVFAAFASGIVGFLAWQFIIYIQQL